MVQHLVGAAILRRWSVASVFGPGECSLWLFAFVVILLICDSSILCHTEGLPLGDRWHDDWMVKQNRRRRFDGGVRFWC